MIRDLQMPSSTQIWIKTRSRNLLREPIQIIVWVSTQTQTAPWPYPAFPSTSIQMSELMWRRELWASRVLARCRICSKIRTHTVTMKRKIPNQRFISKIGGHCRFRRGFCRRKTVWHICLGVKWTCSTIRTQTWRINRVTHAFLASIPPQPPRPCPIFSPAIT